MGSPASAARISFDTRQMSFTPLAFVGTMNTIAKFLPWTGISPWWATKVKCVSADPVATTFAPVTYMPPGLLRDSRHMSVAPPGAPGALSRSTGGWMIAWLMNGTRSCEYRYQRRALS